MDELVRSYPWQNSFYSRQHMDIYDSMTSNVPGGKVHDR